MLATITVPPPHLQPLESLQNHLSCSFSACQRPWVRVQGCGIDLWRIFFIIFIDPG